MQQSLVFEFLEAAGVDRGQYESSWKYFLSFLKQREEITIPINFAMLDLLNMKYTDTVLVRNVEYFIRNPHFTLPIRFIAAWIW